jgi:hypothetical protein
MAGYKYPNLVPDMELAAVIDAASVVPSDTVDLPFATRSLYIGGAGDVTVMLARASASVTYKAVPVGTRLNVSATRVYATGTTATFILAEF